MPASKVAHRQPPVAATTAWAHQADAFWWALDRREALLNLDMGTGKSKVAIDLAVNWGCRFALILCPRSVMSVWRREFSRHAPDWANVLILDRGTVAAKQARAKMALDAARLTGKPLVLVINYESARVGNFANWSLEQVWDLVILDESHRVKGHSAAVSKYAHKLGRCTRRRLALTGTVMPHSPLDAYGQFRFLDPSILGTSWWWFSQKYGVRGNKYFPQAITGYQNLEELGGIIARHSFRVEAADVLDLPPVQHQTRTFTLSPKAERAYRAIKEEFVAEVDHGVCTVANALVKILRLQQITSGHLPVLASADSDERTTVRIDDGKQQVLEDLLADMEPTEPVVVFCWFRHDLQRIAETAAKLGRRYGELSGAANCLTEHATMPEDVDLIGVQMQSGGVGIDLTRARYGIYYSIGHSLGMFEQSLARISRPGQTRPVVYYHILAERTVDQRIYSALRKKREIVDFVLKTLKETGNEDQD